MKRVFSFQTIFCILIFATSVFAKDFWLETTSANFQIAGNIEEKELREIGQKLEQFHLNFQRSFSRIQFKTPFPSKVIIFRNDSSYLQPNQTFIAAEDANYISLSLDKNSIETFENIFHDYTHFLISNNLGQGKIPAWLNEGLAEYFANRTKNELLLEQQSNLISLEILLETDNFTLQNQNEERKAIFQAQSLALLSFLQTEKGAGKFETVEKFIELLLQGKTVKEAFWLVFQTDVSDLETEFRQFLKEPKLLTSNTLEIQKNNGEFEFSPITEAKSLALIGDFLYYSNRRKEAVGVLEKSLKLEPNNALALSTLALIKAKEFYYDEAESLAIKAIEIEPDNFLNHYRYAVVLSKQGMTEHGFVSGYRLGLAEKMRETLKKAIELKPSFTESYALLAFVNYVRNEEINESLGMIKKALEIAPENQRYLLRQAELNLRKENFVEARKDAVRILQTAPGESMRLYAQNTVQRIDSTEYQLNRIRREREKYVNDDIVTEKPLSEEEIRKLREKATAEQIKAMLRRPQPQEKRILASLTKIECGKEKIDFIFKTPTGFLKLQSKNFDGISLISFIEEMSDFRLGCGNISKENNASVIFGNDLKMDKIVSIEFVPKEFKLQN